MAENNTTAGWGAEMHADEHIDTYSGFLTVAKFAVSALVVVILMMAFFLL